MEIEKEFVELLSDLSRAHAVYVDHQRFNEPELWEYANDIDDAKEALEKFIKVNNQPK
jgi:hypothetical protein